MNHQVNLQERMFRLTTPIGMAALLLLVLLKFLLGVRDLYLFGILAYLVIISVIFGVSVHFHRTHIGAVIISAITIILSLPFLFFASGGMYSGVPSWFVFFFVYTCLVLPGWEGVIFLLLSGIIIIGCSYLAYCRPDYLAQPSLLVSYADSASSCILVSIVIGVMIFFKIGFTGKKTGVKRNKRRNQGIKPGTEPLFFQHESRNPYSHQYNYRFK